MPAGTTTHESADRQLTGGMTEQLRDRPLSLTHPPLLPTELACCFTPDPWPFLSGVVIVADGAEVMSGKASGSRGMRLPVLFGSKLLVFFKWETLQQRIDKICLSLHAQYHQEHSFFFFFFLKLSL